MPILYLKGDATVPQSTGNKIIAHVCNDVGGWGRGFVLALSSRWKLPETDYRCWYRQRAQNDFGLGAIRLVQVETDLYIANMVAQAGLRSTAEGPPIRYEALQQCLSRLAVKAQELSASVHMPRIGCGLAGGKWPVIEQIIKDTLGQIEVFVYDFE